MYSYTHLKDLLFRYIFQRNRVIFMFRLATNSCPSQMKNMLFLISRLKSCSITYWQRQQRLHTSQPLQNGKGWSYQCSAEHTHSLSAQTLDSGLSKLADTWLHRRANICITPEEPVLTSPQGHCLDPAQSPAEPEGRKLISYGFGFFCKGHKDLCWASCASATSYSLFCYL